MRRLIACGFESRHWYMIIKVNTNTGNEAVKASDIVRVRQDNINKCTLIMLIDDTIVYCSYNQFERIVSEWNKYHE